jgi:glucose-6-phosphate dehydrogenase assembly protein OpcA
VRGEGEEAVVREMERLGRHSPARAIVLRDHEHDRLDAEAVLDCEIPDEPGLLGICHDRVVLSANPGRLEHADSLVAPLLVSELPVVAWMPDAQGPHRDAVARRADHLVTDSEGDGSSLEASAELAEHGPVHDLAWGRLERWRGAVASAWDPPARRGHLANVSEVEIAHGADAAAEALLLAGWIAARAGLAADAVTLEAGAAGIESVRFAAGDAEIHVEPPPRPTEGGEAFVRALVATRAFRSGYADALALARKLRDH